MLTEQHVASAAPSTEREFNEKARANQLFEEHSKEICIEMDKLFAILLVAEWFAGLATALIWSPRTWAGTISNVHVHVWLAAWCGFAIISLPLILVWKRPGEVLTRHVVAVGQTLMTALLIHLSGGRIETHFLVFGSLAFLTFYRDWRAVVTASAFIAADHVLRGWLFPQSAFGVLAPEPWRWVEHILWVCFADIFFVRQCIQSQKEMRHTAAQRAALENSYEVIEREVVIRTAEAKANEERFRTLCSAAPITIFETDSNGRWIFLGNHWEVLTGRPAAAGIDYGWLDAIHPDDRTRVRVNWETAITAKADWSDEFRIVLADETIKSVRGRATRGTSTDYDNARFIGTIEDVTEQLQNLTNTRHITLMEQRQEFMATLSHDLKNPLIGANRVLELFVGGVLGPLSEKQIELLSQLKDSNDSLLKMIQNLIAAYRYEKEEDGTQFEKLDLVQLVLMCKREMETLAQDKSVNVQVKVPDSPKFIIADESAILRVVRNLLDNALKFTPADGLVKIKIAELEKQVVLKVSNSGSYIAPEKRHMLFHRFWQGQDGKRYVPGTGLGLYICKQIIDSHRGEIACYSDKDNGTEFVISIPTVS